MTSNDDFLKPCPFCGGTAINWITKCSGHGDYDIVIECDCCQCTVTGGRKKQEVIRKWNTRTGAQL
jgi:Lar family restriction alleviation protein